MKKIALILLLCAGVSRASDYDPDPHDNQGTADYYFEKSEQADEDARQKETDAAIEAIKQNDDAVMENQRLADKIDCDKISNFCSESSTVK